MGGGRSMRKGLDRHTLRNNPERSTFFWTGLPFVSEAYEVGLAPSRRSNSNADSELPFSVDNFLISRYFLSGGFPAQLTE
jgi:hypothetical protein